MADRALHVRRSELYTLVSGAAAGLSQGRAAVYLLVTVVDSAVARYSALKSGLQDEGNCHEALSRLCSLLLHGGDVGQLEALK